MTGYATDEPESERERERQRYRELLEELRTVMPGVQVLFGFLLVAPFSRRFSDLDTLGRWAFVGALVTAALATIVLMTPAPYHRLRGHGHRADRVATSERLQMIGMGLLGLATVDAVFVVTRFIIGSVAGGVLAAIVAAAVILLWWVLPLVRARAAASR